MALLQGGLPALIVRQALGGRPDRLSLDLVARLEARLCRRHRRRVEPATGQVLSGGREDVLA
eukprot:15452921-Alexandrium_andersonii.AAC.1